MKSILLLQFVFIFCRLPTGNPDNHTNSTLKKMSDKLNTIKEVSYKYTLNSRYFSEGYEKDYATNVYIKFDDLSPVGFIFQDKNDDYTSIYNGDYAFFIDKRKVTIKLTNKPDVETFSSNTFLVNSIPTLRKFLPVLIAKNPDQIVLSDTTIRGKQYTTASFMLKDTMLHRFGYITPLTVKKNITYTVLIDNDLPYMVVQRDNLNPKDYMSVTFTDMVIDTNRPLPETWRYETYSGQYKPAK